MEPMDVDLDVRPGTSTNINRTGETGAEFKAKSGVDTDISVMAEASSIPSLTVSLHPLVIMNISDHWTRIRAQAGETCEVYGALMGKQNGRNIEVMTSFEVNTFVANETLFINHEYLKIKECQYKEVFSELDFIGWYTTGEQPTEKELIIQHQMAYLNECPIFLQLNPFLPSVDQLPLKIYESVIDIIEGETLMLFVPINYTLATEEAERIGLDHIARMSTNNDTDEKSYVAEHLVAQESAIKMLNRRIKIIFKYIKDVEAGKLLGDQQILREIYALSHRLPLMKGTAFQEEFYTQCNDVGLISYLSIMTKGCNDMNSFVNKFNYLHDRRDFDRRKRAFNHRSLAR